MNRVKMYTTRWCADCWRAKRFLSARGVPVEEIDIEGDADAEAFVRRANDNRSRVPTFEVDGRTFHCSPFDAAKLERELDLVEDRKPS